MLFFAGLPIFFLEIILGQYAGVGPIKTFGHLVPLLKGLGYVSDWRRHLLTRTFDP
jgi:SNF family Na+-dependent transporter